MPKEYLILSVKVLNIRPPDEGGNLDFYTCSKNVETGNTS